MKERGKTSINTAHYIQKLNKNYLRPNISAKIINFKRKHRSKPS